MRISAATAYSQAKKDEEARNIIRKLLAEEEAKDVLASAKDRRDKSKRP